MTTQEELFEHVYDAGWDDCLQFDAERHSSTLQRSRRKRELRDRWDSLLQDEYERGLHNGRIEAAGGLRGDPQ